MPLVSDSNEWKALAEHHGEISGKKMVDLFTEDKERFDKMSVNLAGARQFDMTLDFSKNRVSDDTMEKLLALGKARSLEGYRDKLMKGEKVNTSEGLPATFPSLRHKNPTNTIAEERAKAKAFVLAVRKGEHLGCTGEAITDIVQIGVGAASIGSDMVTTALKNTAGKTKLHFVGNADGVHLMRALDHAHPASTLFIVADDSTVDVALNAATAKEWASKELGDKFDAGKHFAVISKAGAAAADTYGIPAGQCFAISEATPSKFSIWGSMGLSIAIVIGWANFEQVLEGAHNMDMHYKEAPMEKNMPMIMALLSVWYRNFFNFPSHAIVPYDQALYKFASYFQQLETECNGKSVTTGGQPVDFQTAGLVWGQSGTNSQHLIHQFLHQGTTPTPVDFICFAKSLSDEDVIPARHHQVLLANCLAQSESLMLGRTADEVSQSNPDVRGDQVAHMVCEGNRPSNTIIVRKLTPYALGNLMALYEHKVVCQGAIWGINSFDNFGTHFSKQLAEQIEPELDEKFTDVQRDASTAGLIKYIKELQVFNPF